MLKKQILNFNNSIVTLLLADYDVDGEDDYKK